MSDRRDHPPQHPEQGLPAWNARYYAPPPQYTAHANASALYAAPYAGPQEPLPSYGQVGAPAAYSASSSDSSAYAPGSGYASDASHASHSSYASNSSYVSSAGSFATAASSSSTYQPTPATGASLWATPYSTAYSHAVSSPPASASASSSAAYAQRACTHNTCPGAVCQSNNYDPSGAQRFLAANYAPVPREQESWNQRRRREARNAQWKANAVEGPAQYDWKDHTGPGMRYEMHEHASGCADSCGSKLLRREEVKERAWLGYDGLRGSRR